MNHPDCCLVAVAWNQTQLGLPDDLRNECSLRIDQVLADIFSCVDESVATKCLLLIWPYDSVRHVLCGIHQIVFVMDVYFLCLVQLVCPVR